jgi:cytochrome P450
LKIFVTGGSGFVGSAPNIAYSRVKLAAERALLQAHSGNTELVVLRPPFIWGRDPNAAVRAIELPDGTSAWLVTGYEEARQALSDTRLSKVLKAEELGLEPGLSSAMLRMMLFLDPPDHTRLRRLVSAAFTPRRVGNSSSRSTHGSTRRCWLHWATTRPTR